MSYPLPVLRDSELLQLSSVVAARIEALWKPEKRSQQSPVASGVSRQSFPFTAYTRQNTRHTNLYRIQLPREPLTGNTIRRISLQQST